MADSKQQPVNEELSLSKMLPDYGGADEYSSIYSNVFIKSLGEKTEKPERIDNSNTYKGKKGELTIYSSNLMKTDKKNEVLKKGDEIILSFSELNFRVVVFLMRQLRLSEEQVSIIQVDDYRKLCKLSDNKTAKEQLKDTLDLLMSLTFELNINDPYARDTFHIKDQLIYKYADNSKSFAVHYSDLFYTYLQERKQQTLDLPNLFFTISLRKNPNALNILYAFCFRRRATGNEELSRRLSVKNLLNACSYRSYKELKDSGGIQRYIIDRFFNDLNALSSVFSFRLCHEGGKPLTKAEQPNRNSYNFSYAFFISLYVEITWLSDSHYNVTEARNDYELTNQKKKEKSLKKKEKRLKNLEKELDERERALSST